jgi:hypothetical protein
MTGSITATKKKSLKAPVPISQATLLWLDNLKEAAVKITRGAFLY